MHPIADFWWCHRQDAVWCKGIPPNDKIVKLTKCAATLGNKTGTEVGKIFLHVTWIMPGLDLKLPILDCPWLGGKSKFKFIKILNYILLHDWLWTWDWLEWNRLILYLQPPVYIDYWILYVLILSWLYSWAVCCMAWRIVSVGEAGQAGSR